MIMWYDYPQREDFNLIVDIEVAWSVNNKLKLKYKQATIFETMDFLKTLEEWKTVEWTLDFIKNHWGTKIALWFIKIDNNLFNKVFETIKNSLFRWVFGKAEAKNDWGGTQPYSAILVFVCEKLNISPHEFQNEYTIEQMNYLLDWIIYNINEWTEEWQEKNQRNNFNKENKDEDLLDLIS